MKRNSKEEAQKNHQRSFLGHFAMYRNDIGLLIKSSPLFFFLTIVIASVNICVPIVAAFLIKSFVDIIELKQSLFAQGAIFSLVIIALLIFLTYFISSVLSAIMEIITYKTTERLDDSIQQKTIDKLRKIRYEEFDDAVFLNDLYKASDYSAEILKNNMMVLIKIGTCIVSLGFICGILFNYSILVLCIVVASSVLSAVLNLYWEKRKIKLYNETVLINRKLAYFEGCMRDPEVIREFRGFNAMNLIREKYAQNWDESIKAIEDNEKKGFLISTINHCNSVTAYSVSYFIIGGMLFRGGGNISDFIYLVTMLQTFTSLLKDIISVLPDSKRSRFILQNYNKILKKPSKIDRMASSHLENNVPIEIEFKNVSFKYPKAKEYTLKNLSFLVRSNSLLGIVGANGAGKSTIIKLMLGLYEPTEGEILINGKDMKELPYEEIIDNCSVIFQDYSKYATTLKENIYLGNVKEKMNEDRIKASGKKSGVEAFIDQCKNGWNQELTKKLTEEGMELSGGQWQRLALAKAFYKDTRLIILDEPTASLDPKIEHDMFSCVDDNSKTRIIVSHRLGNMIHANMIILLENGSIKEFGTHEELLRENGEYAKMFLLQAANYQ